MQDIFSKCSGDSGYFAQLRLSNDHYFSRPLLPPKPSNRMEFQGKECIMWSINNYLGLANNESIKQQALASIQEYGLSAPMGSRMMSGTTRFHRELEQKLADYSQKEAAYLFNYGYLGVLGTISAIVSPEDTIIIDKLAHACIIDGAFLCNAPHRFFQHNNISDLESILKQVSKNTKGGILVAVEGVYGMTGDLANLKDICALKKHYNFRLFVDDAHGVGVMGERGCGTGEYFGVQDDIDIYFGTFAKSFAAIGGFSASHKAVIEWIEFNARTQIFAKSLPIAYTQSLLTALDLVRSADAAREKMWSISKELKEGLGSLGYTVGGGESPICSVFIPSSNNRISMQTIRYLRDRGVFVTAVIYPVIPHGLTMLRMIPTAAHTREDVAQTLQAFSDLKESSPNNFALDENNRQKLQKIFR